MDKSCQFDTRWTSLFGIHTEIAGYAEYQRHQFCHEQKVPELNIRYEYGKNKKKEYFSTGITICETLLLKELREAHFENALLKTRF
jgi:hypothetical protein